ncbi:MAG: DNA polymerase I, partial [Cyanobacteria bacterium]|nr:DNA polymerase I [Cyanobacteriota bacterium]
SDNIPGVKGIGPKTAVQLLADYKTLEGIYENVDSIKSKSIKAKLVEQKDRAMASQQLATIMLDVPVEFDFHHCRLTIPDVVAVGKFFKSLQFRGLVNRIPKVLASFKHNGEREAVAKEINEVLKGITASPVTFDDIGFGSEMGPPERSDEPGETRENAKTREKDSRPVISVPTFTGQPEPLIVCEEGQLSELIQELANSQIFVVDLETSNLNALDTDIVGWSFAWGEGLSKNGGDRLKATESDDATRVLKTAYVPVRHQDLTSSQLNPDLVRDRLKAILEDAGVAKISQNAKFDINVLARHDIDLRSVIFDTMLASYIVDSGEKHGLKEQSDRILGYQMKKISELIGTSKKTATMSQAQIVQAAPYAADEARVTFELARYYARRMDEAQAELMYAMELPLSRVLAKMEQRGVAIDRDFLAGLSKELSEVLLKSEKEIYDLVGYSFNINSTQQLQKVLFEDIGLAAKARTKTGFSTDASVLETLKGEHPVVEKIVDYRHISKLRSTYVDALPKQISEFDHRLHGEFNQTVAATGRLSSSNPNLQNIPIRTELGRSIRRAFVPGASGYSLVSADYSQIELRMLAHMSGDETLIDAFEKNQDIHARTAMEIFDVPMEKVDSNMRRVGKTINFALVYQQGAWATAQDLGISTREAKTFIDKYFNRMPKVKDLLARIIEEAKHNDYVTTLWGRRRYFRHLNDRNTNIRRADERAACNAPLQGSAADLIKLAMIDLDSKLEEAGTKARMILQVHDELVLEVPDDEIEVVQSIMGTAMEQGQPLKVPLKIDFGVGKDWMNLKQ